MSDKYKDEEWLKAEYGKKRRSTAEIAEECGVNRKTVWYWADKYNLNRYRRPWECEQLMHHLYVNKEYSIQDLCKELDGTPPRILECLEKYEIETRSRRKEHCTVYFHDSGYLRAEATHNRVYIHRLIAVANGYDPYDVFSSGKHVHHKNGCTFDNRHSNIELVSEHDHISGHNTGEKNNDAKLTSGDVKEMRQKYREMDITQAEIAEDYGVTQSQVSDIVNEEVWCHV
jgi:transposase-like protein